MTKVHHISNGWGMSSHDLVIQKTFLSNVSASPSSMHSSLCSPYKQRNRIYIHVSIISGHALVIRKSDIYVRCKRFPFPDSCFIEQKSFYFSKCDLLIGATLSFLVIQHRLEIIVTDIVTHTHSGSESTTKSINDNPTAYLGTDKPTLFSVL